MEFITDPHYQAIQAFYTERRAKRSGVLYIQHINEGLLVLDAIDATLPARQAYCLHPIVQGDTELSTAFQPTSVLYQYPIDLYALALAIEYRWVANSYLSQRTIHSLDEIQLSPLADVQQMLIADKVQNRKDFERYHRETHPRTGELERYFGNWLAVLGISETRYQELVRYIIAYTHPASEGSSVNTTCVWLPNKALEPTPLCGPKIGAILEAGFGPSVFPIGSGSMCSPPSSARPIHAVVRCGGTILTRVGCRKQSSARPSWRRSLSGSPVIPFGTVLRPICSKMGTIFARCRSARTPRCIHDDDLHACASSWRAWSAQPA